MNDAIHYTVRGKMATKKVNSTEVLKK